LYFSREWYNKQTNTPSYYRQIRANCPIPIFIKNNLCVIHTPVRQKHDRSEKNTKQKFFQFYIKVYCSVLQKTAIRKKKMNYTIKKSKRAKIIRITIRHNGEVILTVPRQASIRLAKKFLEEKKNWILKKIEFLNKHKNPEFVNLPKDDYKKKKKAARRLAVDRIKHFNKFYNFKFNKITVRNQRTRWGSCSSHGNLNFNYKIIYLPDHIADYIIVHELCHLEQHNHSKNFWAMVAKTIPDYKKIKKELRFKSLILQ